MQKNGAISWWTGPKRILAMKYINMHGDPLRQVSEATIGQALFHRFIQSANFTPEVLVAFLN